MDSGPWGIPCGGHAALARSECADPAKKATRLFDAAIGQTEVLETFEKMLVPILGPTLDANVGDRERTPTVGGPFAVCRPSFRSEGPKKNRFLIFVSFLVFAPLFHSSLKVSSSQVCDVICYAGHL